MGNYAKYWFLDWKGIQLTDTIKKGLENFGFSTSRNGDYELFYDVEDDKLIFIYGEHTQIGWKQEFERFCKDNNIPIQKWMEG